MVVRAATVLAVAASQAVVVCESTKGPVRMDIRDDWAPSGAARFLSLVRKGVLDGTMVHRVVPGSRRILTAITLASSQFTIPLQSIDMMLHWKEHACEEEFFFIKLLS